MLSRAATLCLILFLVDANSRPVPLRLPAAAKAVSACPAVTRADAEVAVGRKVNRGEEQTADGSSTCDYSAAGG